MAIRIYDLDRKHVIDTEFGKFLDQYREIMDEYEIPWNDADWWFNEPEGVECYDIMGNLYAVTPCDEGTYYVYAKEHCNYTYGREYDSLLDAYEGILDEWRR